MVLISVRNGLGNQMFIYAFGEYLKQKYPNQKIYYDLSSLPRVINGRLTNKIEDIFTNEFQIATDRIIRLLAGKKFYFSFFDSNSSVIDKIRLETGLFVRRNKAVSYIDEPDYWNVDENFVKGIMRLSLDDNNNYFFNGFWEDINYINALGEHIFEIFNFREIPVTECLNKILNSNSVGIHVRRGDYLKESQNTSFPKNDYCVCNDDYYNKAINLINTKILNPRFFFFTDDTEFVKEKFSFIDNKLIVSGNKDYEDMYYMTQCKHVIIANSTFSFWGALLNRNNGMIISPNLHYIHFEDKDNVYYKPFFIVKGWNYINNYPNI